MLDDARLPESDNERSDPFHMLLEAELTGCEAEGEGLRERRLAETLAAQGVVHSHANRAVIGPSRVEQHISACAAKDVSGGEAAHLPAALCDMLEPTQGSGNWESLGCSMFFKLVFLKSGFAWIYMVGLFWILQK
jgi:hypothetical protein